MPGTFDDYFEDDDTPAFRGDFAQQCLTAGDPLVDYARFDTVLCVSPAVNMADPATRRAAWPSASLGEWGPYKTAEGDLALGIISMPAEWTELDGRQLYATLAHELAHNLGLSDQYRPDAGIVSIDGWDLMHADAELPHLSLGHRLMLGWVDPSHVLSFNVARLPPARRLVGRYTLDPVEKTVPFENLPVERHLIGIEFRKADGVMRSACSTVPGGRSPRASFARPLTWASARAMSVPEANVTDTSDVPRIVRDRSCVTPGTDDSAASSGRVTVAAVRSAAASPERATTTMRGKSISG
jgi:hypothetical protein